MVAGLLTVALLFFVVAQAAVTRSGGQSAADAAALAAAQEAADHFLDDFLAAADRAAAEDGDREEGEDGEDDGENGENPGDEDAGEDEDPGRDEELDEDLEDILDGDDPVTGPACQAAARLAADNDADLTACELAGDRPGFHVRVETHDTVGNSLLPGTEDRTATAEATAVIDGLCRLDTDEEPDEDGHIRLSCDEDRNWSIDPGDADQLPEARDLFKVYLED
ncbi:hypothetical protein [Streptomyces hoynatensis]|uniref:Flp pilus-assembly TadG-like N-terminal domain-containing protein n=1 Tax=Streptomyces hoynatensis TaxID=1141874 RepID=A0A3A9ZI21_9ACTN|nr:hypothetical protein [Streptomyces hoynatensis]RKN46987.1 hypothetical protein D7294_01990 [Streptomyces hoynatensis]